MGLILNEKISGISSDWYYEIVNAWNADEERDYFGYKVKRFFTKAAFDAGEEPIEVIKIVTSYPVALKTVSGIIADEIKKFCYAHLTRPIPVNVYESVDGNFILDSDGNQIIESITEFNKFAAATEI